MEHLDFFSVSHSFLHCQNPVGTVLVALTLILYEITNAFHRLIVAGEITSSEAEFLLERALNLGLMLYGDAQLHQEALKVANTTFLLLMMLTISPLPNV